MNLQDFFDSFSNLVKRSFGPQRDLSQLIYDKDISAAKRLFQDDRSRVEANLREYDPDNHIVKYRRDKERSGRGDYNVEKLTRNWQEYINEVALFFLLGGGIKWKCEDESANDAFSAFNDFLKEVRFISNLRQSKRYAGSEGAVGKLYRVYKDSNNNARVKIVQLAHSGNWRVMPLFDIYGSMTACGVEYFSRRGNNTIEHFDIHTPDAIYKCTKKLGAWDVDVKSNPVGKICIVYYSQESEWRRVQNRIDRSELLDCKIADTNNYFADPMAAASADVINSLPDVERPGKLIELRGRDSRFEYINPPTASELQRLEIENNRQAILQDSFTPDFDFKAMAGTGTLSGEAIKRALILGYIKRSKNIEIYEPLIDREKNIIISIMKNVTHLGLGDKLDRLKKSLTFEFSEPFSEDISKRISDLSNAVNSGILSVDEAVRRLGFVSDTVKEIGIISRKKIGY